MHPRVTELLSYVERETAVLRAAFESVPPERRGLRPAESRWSAAEVLHHLALVERRIAMRMKGLIEQARAHGGGPETETISALASFDTARVVDRTERFVTSEASTPTVNDPASAWDDLMSARGEVLNVVVEGDGLALGTVTAPHPVFGPLNVYQWIAFVGSHAARHADQIVEDERLREKASHT